MHHLLKRLMFHKFHFSKLSLATTPSREFPVFLTVSMATWAVQKLTFMCQCIGQNVLAFIILMTWPD